MEKQELISMSELANELGINKSKLNYYINYGLIVPVQKFGKLTVLDKKETISILKKIETKSKQGKTLEEIKNELN